MQSPSAAIRAEYASPYAIFAIGNFQFMGVQFCGHLLRSNVKPARLISRKVAGSGVIAFVSVRVQDELNELYSDQVRESSFMFTTPKLRLEVAEGLGEPGEYTS